ncbi:MAG: efflux RND transporter periplasmic adaptor subunit [Bacteroidetes bacterium]|nr:efflux RND transporter periplasmic adaptor subunit [Bacteroidota bacterium]
MGVKKNISIVFITTIVFAVVVAIAYFLGFFVPDALHSGNFKTEIIKRGSVISGVTATGIVESENEVQILSPASSLIKRIYTEPGSWIEKGEIILELDTENVKNEIENITDQLEMKRNSLDKTRLNAQSTYLDLEYNEEVKKLKITSLESELADQLQLLEVGGISPARIDKTKQEITLAKKDLQTLSAKNSIRLKQLIAEEKGLLIQIRMQDKDLIEKQEILKSLKITAPSSGIILAITKNEGQRADADKMLIRISDLTSFKITGSIDEQFAKQIKTGNRVFVKIDNEYLEGRVGIITPMVENKKVQFNVHLKEKSHPKLIANQNVEIQIVNDKKDSVLLIKKYPEFEVGQKHIVFVVEKNVAIKKEIILGIKGKDSCEVISGLNEGAEVIVEGISAYRKLSEIEIQN